MQVLSPTDELHSSVSKERDFIENECEMGYSCDNLKSFNKEQSCSSNSVQFYSAAIANNSTQSGAQPQLSYRGSYDQFITHNMLHPSHTANSSAINMLQEPRADNMRTIDEEGATLEQGTIMMNRQKHKANESITCS